MIGAKLGAGREAEVYAWGTDAVIKLYRPGFGGHRPEAVALAALDSYRVAPGLVDVVSWDGRTGLVLERLGGVDLLTLLRHQPWRLLGLARVLATTHRAIHAVPAPEGLPELRPALVARIEDADLPARLRDFALRVLDRLPDGDRLCHGDYHPGNVLVAADRATAIDWVAAARGVPEADYARTMLLLRMAGALPGTPAPSRALIAAGRPLFAQGYARTYCGGTARPLRQVDMWLVGHAAARLSEGIDGERSALIGMLDRARRSAGSRAAGDES